MVRVKRGTIKTKRRKHILEYTKGFKWGRKNKLRLAREALLHAWSYAYRDRKVKKREKRKLWQTQINAAVRKLGLSYSKFMGALKKKNIEIDRKVLATLANKHPNIFKKIVEEVKK
jgi:large subunit ribosomal protein L20